MGRLACPATVEWLRERLKAINTDQKGAVNEDDRRLVRSGDAQAGILLPQQRTMFSQPRSRLAVHVGDSTFCDMIAKLAYMYEPAAVMSD
jgi:hypothetical protein